MAANYWLLVKIETEPDVRDVTKSEFDEFTAAGVNTHEIGYGFELGPAIAFSARDYSRAAGTYVEVENTGDVCTFYATQLEFDVLGDFEPWPPDSGSPDQSLRLELPRVGRPIVLLAVPGGNQGFDHWLDETGISICAGQGARCEVPEPAEDYGYTLFAKAVFKKKPEDGRLGPLDPSCIPAPPTRAAP